MRKWTNVTFESIKLRKHDSLQNVEALDIVKDSRRLTLEEARKEQELLDNLNEICKQEEIYWKQRSRLQWLKEADENTKFYHVVANGRKNRNYIPRICQNGVTLTNPRDIGNVFTSQFKQQFVSKRPSRFRIDFQKLFKNKISVDLTQLERPFTLEEVKREVFDLGGDKAPGPDGFQFIS